MVGQTIDSRSPFPLAAIVLLLGAAALAACALITSNPHILIAAILPLIVGVCAWCGRPGNLVLTIENDGLQSFGTAKKLYYSDMTEVAIGGGQFDANFAKLPALPIEIHHLGGCLVVPPQMNVPLTDFYRFLVSRVPARPPRPIPEALADYVNEQTLKFGADKVHVIHTRRSLSERWRRRRSAWICAGIILTGLIWAVLSIGVLVMAPRRDEFTGWLVGGVMLGMVGALVYFATGSKHARPSHLQAARFPNSCLVLSPAGLAMVQGDLKGAMPWREITGVSTKMSQWLRPSRVAGLQIRVRGSEIIAFDIYERTPAELESLVRSNLDPQR